MSRDASGRVESFGCAFIRAPSSLSYLSDGAHSDAALGGFLGVSAAAALGLPRILPVRASP